MAAPAPSPTWRPDPGSCQLPLKTQKVGVGNQSPCGPRDRARSCPFSPLAFSSHVTRVPRCPKVNCSRLEDAGDDEEGRPVNGTAQDRRAPECTWTPNDPQAAVSTTV